ncbi:DedA family protein [Alphaproteobacteria bacterium]|nr:DedA family protein [Alphaproteobacteria bacterium]MDC1023130.1 DedA family protein [Alphaproteobacteria bacterium]
MKKINSKNFENKINILIEKAQSNAINPLADKILGFIAMIESIVFPIPVDPFLAGLTLAAPQKALRFALICTISSVLGGIIGWLLGYLIGPSIEVLIVNIPWFTEEKFNAVKSAYKENGILIIFIGAFTPLPYKIITLTSGMAGVNLIAFILISALGRGIRFFIVAYLIKFFGNPALIYLKNNMLLFTSILGIAIIIISFYIF